MTWRIRFCGAIGEVTGSGALLDTGEARILVDFGMFQGRGPTGEASAERNRELGPVDPSAVDAVVLTHAHLDHCGRLPVLAEAGYRRKVFATPATADLARVLLDDAARIAEEDARRDNRRRERAGLPPQPPLFGRRQVLRLGRLIRPVAYDAPTRIAPGVELVFRDAGHILGSASAELHLGGGRVLVFSGDLGSPGMPILRDPQPPTTADAVVLESTYGDREHPPRAESVDRFVGLLAAAHAERRRVLVPAFAVGRTQNLLYHVAAAIRDGRLPRELTVFLDSPTAQRATDVYMHHQDLYDAETGQLARHGGFLRDIPGLRMIRSARESIRLNDGSESGVIVAGAGMCDGGRIVHHLKHNLWREGVDVVIAGYMAPGTLGRRLVDGENPVPILGEEIAVRARIHALQGFSAHADARELVEWLRPAAGGGGTPSPSPLVILNHGEDSAREGLRGRIQRELGIVARVPARGEAVEG